MTSFSESNAAYSAEAHRAAQEQFYPQLWPGRKLNFIDTVKAVEDLKYGVDVIAEVSLPDPDARGPVKFYIQERWRRPDNRTYQDLTITEWNLQSNQPSELHKLGAQLFVYGYYDDTTKRIVEAVAVDIMRMQHANVRGELKYQRRRRRSGDQSFITVEWDHLSEIDALIHMLKDTPNETFEDLIDGRWTPEQYEMWFRPVEKKG